MVSEEREPFGRSLSEVVFRIIIAIAESEKMVFTVSEIKGLALRPTVEFMQVKGGISKTVRDIRMKQASFIAAFIMALNGVITIVSTKKFSTQH